MLDGAGTSALDSDDGAAAAESDDAAAASAAAFALAARNAAAERTKGTQSKCFRRMRRLLDRHRG